MNRFFPFHSLGFRSNPFRTLTDEEWVQVAVIPRAVEETLAAGFTHLQILGQKGSGKTTLLLSLAARLQTAGQPTAYEYIPEDGRTFQTPLQSLHTFLLDEAQRLTQPERKRLLHQAPAVQLILAAHEDLTPLFTAHHQPLTTIDLSHTGPDHLQAVISRRLAHFALERPPPITLSTEAIAYLWQQFGRDIRSAEQFLYEYFQQLPPQGTVTKEMLSPAAK